MRLGLTLVSTLYLLSVFLPVLALPPPGISTPPSLAKRNHRNGVSDIEARSPHLVTLRKRWGLGALIRGLIWVIRKIVGAVNHAKHWAKEAHKWAKKKSEDRRVQHVNRVRKGADKVNNQQQQQQQQQGQQQGHRRRSLLDPRGEQVYPEFGNKMKRSLVYQKRGLNRRMKRQLRERSNTGFDELD